MPEFPRPLSDRERSLLSMLLPTGAFPDVEVYREQVEHAHVIGRCPCGCPTINLAVDRKRAKQAHHHGDPLLPVEAHAGEDEQHMELILFARDGWLESLEIVWIDNPPAELPPREHWQLLNNAA